MPMEHWWNYTEGGKTSTRGHPVPVANSPLQILHGITWDRVLVFAVRSPIVFGDNRPQTKSRWYFLASHIGCPFFDPRIAHMKFWCEEK